MVYYNVSTDASAAEAYMSAQINDVATSTYRSIHTYSSGSAFVTGSTTGATMWRLGSGNVNDASTVNCYGYIYLNKVLTTSLADFVQIRTTCASTAGSGTNYLEMSSGTSEESDIESIQLRMSANQIKGSFTVNAMDF